MESDDFDAALADLEVRLERLRSLYEQYFLGIERIEPTVARKDVDRRFWQLRKVKVRNTARRFKLQTLVSRYNTLQQHWMKVCRQIENGTYVRHLARAQRRFTSSGTPPHEPNDGSAAEQPAWSDDGPTPEQVRRAFSALANAEPTRAARPPPPLSTGAKQPAASAPPPPERLPSPGATRTDAPPTRVSAPNTEHNTGHSPRRPVAPPRRHARQPAEISPAPAAQDSASNASFRQLYDEFVRQRALYEPNSRSVSAPALAQSLRATEAKLKAKHGARRVEFRVEQKDGKVVIKPTVHR